MKECKCDLTECQEFTRQSIVTTDPTLPTTTLIWDKKTTPFGGVEKELCEFRTAIKFLVNNTRQYVQPPRQPLPERK